MNRNIPEMVCPCLSALEVNVRFFGQVLLLLSLSKAYQAKFLNASLGAFHVTVGNDLDNFYITQIIFPLIEIMFLCVTHRYVLVIWSTCSHHSHNHNAPGSVQCV